MIRNFRAGDIVTTGEHFATGQRELGLAVQYRLRMFLGEYFLDVTQGTPWFQSVLGKSPQDSAEAILKQRIIETDGVAAIRQFRFEPDLQRRRINISAILLRTDGAEQDFELNEEIA